LKIVASQDIGEMGLKEVKPVIYDWNWYYNIPGLALWVVLLGAIVLVKANHNPHALLIALPLLAVNLLWLGFVKLLNFPSIARAQYDPLFVSSTVSIAVLWLLAHKLGNRNRFVTFLLALIIMIVVGFVGQVSYNSIGELSYQTTLFFMFQSLAYFAVLVAFVLTAFICHKLFYHGLLFSLLLGFWTVIISIIAILTFVVVMFGFEGRLPRNVTDILLQVLVMGLVTGLLLYAINLSFMILALSSPFYRERFYACLRLKSMPTISGQADTGLSGNQSPDAM